MAIFLKKFILASLKVNLYWNTFDEILLKSKLIQMLKQRCQLFYLEEEKN